MSVRIRQSPGAFAGSNLRSGAGPAGRTGDGHIVEASSPHTLRGKERRGRGWAESALRDAVEGACLPLSASLEPKSNKVNAALRLQSLGTDNELTRGSAVKMTKY